MVQSSKVVHDPEFVIASGIELGILQSSGRMVQGLKSRQDTRVESKQDTEFGIGFGSPPWDLGYAYSAGLGPFFRSTARDLMGYVQKQ